MKVEKVVNPPQKPVVNNNQAAAECRGLYSQKMPNNRQPKKLATSVGIG